MLILGLALFAALAAIAVFPCWPHSRHLGFGPSLAAGSLLVLAALIAVSHKADSLTMQGPTTVASTAVSAAVPD